MPPDVIDVLLQQLESEERALSRRRQKLHVRIATFPDTTGSWAAEEREISKRRRKLHRQIDALRNDATTAAPPVEESASRQPA